MDTNDYRRKIEQSVAKVHAKIAKPSARGRAEDLPRLIANKKTPAKTRAEALGRVMRAEGPDAVPQIALDRLSDPKESPVVRLAAIKLLQQKQIFSSVAAEWRPAFVEGLRSAVRDRKVRAAALEVLSLLKDRPTQELLLEGIRKPARALVPIDEALRLLSTDVHADVIEMAKKVTATPQMRKNKKAFVQAVRILAADPASVDKLEEVLTNSAYAMDARRVAATAVSHLAPSVVERALTSQGAGRGQRGARGVAAGKPKDALAKQLETLQRIRG